MKKINFILLLSFFTAITILSGCSQPASASKEDPPLPPSAQELISDSIYQTAFEGDNPKTATQLRFSEDETIAQVWGVIDFSSSTPESYAQNKEMMIKNNPRKKMDFDDKNQLIYIDAKYTYKLKDLLDYGNFSTNYDKYIMTDYKGDPEETYIRQN